MTNLPEILPFGDLNRFAPKLTFNDRCAIFALYHYKRTSQSLLAEAFGVHRRTAIMICDTNGRLYKDIHRELTRLGIVDMFNEYVRPDHIHRVNQAIVGRRDKPRITYNRASNKKEGIHWFKNEKVEIRWQEQVDGKPFGGWAININDLGWCGNGDDEGKPFRTSSEAFRWAEKFHG